MLSIFSQSELWSYVIYLLIGSHGVDNSTVLHRKRKKRLNFNYISIQWDCKSSALTADMEIDLNGGQLSRKIDCLKLFIYYSSLYSC